MLIGLKHLHSSLAYLLFLSSTVSLAASLMQLGGPKPGALRVATVLLRKVEPAVLGLMGLVGLGLWHLAAWPVGTWWIWLGVVVWAGSPMLVARGAKPALAGLAAGDGSQAGRLVAVAATSWVLITAAVGAMSMK